MGRSVSVPSEASDVAYASFECEDAYDDYSFREAVEGMQYQAMKKYPSLSKADRWIGRENHVVLENKYCSITVSEYCGLVAVAIVPSAGYSLSESWCNKVNLVHFAEFFGQPLRSAGRFSNGEQIFNAIGAPNKGAMGLGFSSKEGWL
jgi:hypothetical protein